MSFCSLYTDSGPATRSGQDKVCAPAEFTQNLAMWHLPLVLFFAFNVTVRKQSVNNFIFLFHRFVCTNAAPSLHYHRSLLVHYCCVSPSLSCRVTANHVFSNINRKKPEIKNNEIIFHIQASVCRLREARASAL